MLSVFVRPQEMSKVIGRTNQCVYITNQVFPKITNVNIWHISLHRLQCFAMCNEVYNIINFAVIALHLALLPRKREGNSCRFYPLGKKHSLAPIWAANDIMQPSKLLTQMTSPKNCKGIYFCLTARGKFIPNLFKAVFYHA